jgi:hypothetical protein
MAVSLGAVFPVPSPLTPTPATTGGPGITDWLTGLGTVGLALVTVVTLIVTIVITTTDRRRADAAQQEAEKARRRDRQQDSARSLLARIAGLMPYFDLVPGVIMAMSPPFGYPPSPRALECYDAMRALEFGAHAELSGLGNASTAEQYRTLVHLVLTAAPPAGRNDQTRKLVSGDLRRYALFVQVSLENLVEHGQSLGPGQPAFPRLDRTPGDQSLWSPEHTPPAWLDALRRQPGDPLFEPAA